MKNFRNSTRTRFHLTRNLKFIRAQLDWTQERMATEATINRGQYNEIENGKAGASIDALARLGFAAKVYPYLLIMPKEEAEPLLAAALERNPDFKKAQKKREQAEKLSTKSRSSSKK